MKNKFLVVALFLSFSEKVYSVDGKDGLYDTVIKYAFLGATGGVILGLGVYAVTLLKQKNEKEITNKTLFNENKSLIEKNKELKIDKERLLSNVNFLCRKIDEAKKPAPNFQDKKSPLYYDANNGV
jgi:hypothetical protein